MCPDSIKEEVQCPSCQGTKRSIDECLARRVTIPDNVDDKTDFVKRLLLKYHAARLWEKQWKQGTDAEQKFVLKAGEVAKFGHKTKMSKLCIDQMYDCQCCRCEGRRSAHCCDACRKNRTKSCTKRGGQMRKVTWSTMVCEEMQDEAGQAVPQAMQEEEEEDMQAGAASSSDADMEEEED